MWAENRDGEVLLNNTWVVVFGEGYPFWNDYTSLVKNAGSKKARLFLNSLVNEEGLSLAVVLAPGAKHLNDREIESLLEGEYRHSKYLDLKLGVPVDWQKVKYFRNMPNNHQGELTAAGER